MWIRSIRNTAFNIFRRQTHSLTGFLDHFSLLINSFRVFLFLTLSHLILSLPLHLSFPTFLPSLHPYLPPLLGLMTLSVGSVVWIAFIYCFIVLKQIRDRTPGP
jgi:hypothetical protein